jgi:Bacterial protein of unknown function (DUF922)
MISEPCLKSLREALARTKQARVAMVTAYAFAWLLWLAPAICEPIAYDTPEWQKEIAHGCLPYHRLVRGDFPIDDKAHSRFAMYTSGFYHYNYTYDCTGEQGHVIARITGWKVRSGFNRNKSSRKSWFKFVERLLPHEQGHLDLNELHGRQLARMDPARLPTGAGETKAEAIKDLQRKLKTLSDKTSKDGQAEQDAYDAETAHGTNKPRQLTATAAIQKRLKQAGITYAAESNGDQMDAVSEPKTPLDEAGRALNKNR